MCKVCKVLNPSIMKMAYCSGQMWDREGVIWTPEPEILGVPLYGGAAIDFGRQIGMYFLYGINRLVHCGLTDSLGATLWGHTQDRWASRWNAFSWIGFWPVQYGAHDPVPPKGGWNYIYQLLFEAIRINLFGPYGLTEHDEEVTHENIVEYLQHS